MKHRNLFKSLLVSSAVALTSVSGVALADDTGKSTGNVRFHGGDEILLQGFHWNTIRTNNNTWYNTLYNMVDQTGNNIKDLGVTAIWMPPPWRDWSSWSNPTTGVSGGGEGYFWHDWNLNSQYGPAADQTGNKGLGSAAYKLLTNGVKPIYDIVPNHRNHSVFNAENQYTFPGAKWFWGGADAGDQFISGDADLNTANGDVYTDIKNAMNNLKANYSAQGFRFDFVRGFGSGTVSGWMYDVQDNGFCVGELWKDPISQQQLKDWSSGGNCTAFDFALKREMVSGDVTKLIYGLNGNTSTDWRERAVTFVDNHDTGYSPGANGGQHHWPTPDSIRDQAYAYILTSPGTPSVYWPDAFDWGRYAMIKSLISTRKDAKVRAYSDIKFCMSSAPFNQQCAQNNNQSGLVYTVNKGCSHTGCKQLLGAVGSGLSDPNTVEPAGTGFQWDLLSQGGWGKIWVRNVTQTPPPVDNPVSPDPTVQRSMIMIYASTSSGQDMFVRGGIDHTWAAANLGRTCTAANKLCALGHNIRNRLNNYTTGWENGDKYMDWYGIEAGQGAGAEGTPFEWTTNNSAHYDATKDRNGAAPTGYLDSGFGYYAANSFGAHYWLYDVDLDCANAVQVTGSGGGKQKIFEFKSYVKGGAGWESDRDTNSYTSGGQTYNVYNQASGNHYAVCGKLTKTSFNSNAMDVYDIQSGW